MSEKKFRAWDNVLNRMVYYDLESLRNGDADLNTIAPDGINESKQMLFMNLKDKNGKDIYEGDVVRFTVPGHPDEPLDYRNVIVKIPDFWIEQFDSVVGIGHQEMEVIGNVHKNPELIKEKHDQKS